MGAFILSLFTKDQASVYTRVPFSVCSFRGSERFLHPTKHLMLFHLYWTFFRWTSLACILVAVLHARMSDESNLQDELRVGGDVSGETAREYVSTTISTKD